MGGVNSEADYFGKIGQLWIVPNNKRKGTNR